MSRKKKLGFGFIGIAVILVAAASIYALKGSGETDLESVQVERYTIPAREHIFINGNIAPRETEVFGTDSSKGKVHSVHVEEGQIVDIGTPIVTYKREEIGPQIKELEQQIEEAKEAKKTQEISSRVAEESEMTASPSVDYDSQIGRLNARLEELKNEEYTVDTAGIEGSIYIEDISIQEGVNIEKIIVQSNEYISMGTVNEKDVLNLSEGMKAEISIVSNDEKLVGQVEKISARPNSGQQSISGMEGSMGGQSLSEYEVIINMESYENVKEGFHVQAKVVYGEDRTIIPSEAILKNGEKQSVFLIEKGSLKKKDIETEKLKDSEQLKSDGEPVLDTVVVKGLKQGDEIVLNPGKDLKEGDLVE